ncbi:MAG: hypothetical protein QY318_00910 [Candidatus Dojkabacteria bacterium]|nr:MAG: hypothetical protein QY318_00910 [Candidatus Dojkabacteria bacterium]
MSNAQNEQRPTILGGLLARIVTAALQTVDASETGDTRIGGRIRKTAYEVFADEGVQAEAERITATEVDAARAQIPDAFAIAGEGLATRAEVTATYEYIRASLRTENETFFQKLYRPIVARMLSIGAGISSLLTVKYAERWYTGDFTNQQHDEYRDTMRKWYAIWLANIFRPRPLNADQATQQNPVPLPAPAA